MEMKETTKAEDKPVMKTRRKITSLDDDGLWAGFEWEETDRIMSGEIKPKTLITAYSKDQRATLVAQEIRSVFPNSKFMRMKSDLLHVMKLAKTRGCTSLIVAHTNRYEHDELIITNLLNGASAAFRVYDLIEQAYIPNRVAPPSRRYPHLHVRGFDSLASFGTARMIQSLFPKVSHSRRPSRTRSNAWLEKQKNYVFFRHHRFCSEEALAGESSSSRTKTKWKECGPRFALELLAISRASFHTGNFQLICEAPLDGLRPLHLLKMQHFNKCLKYSRRT